MSVPTVILNRAVSRERLPLAFVRLLGLVRYVVQGGTMPARDSETHSLMDVSLSHDLAMLIANMLEDQLRPLQDSNNVIGDMPIANNTFNPIYQRNDEHANNRKDKSQASREGRLCLSAPVLDEPSKESS